MVVAVFFFLCSSGIRFDLSSSVSSETSKRYTTAVEVGVCRSAKKCHRLYPSDIHLDKFIGRYVLDFFFFGGHAQGSSHELDGRLTPTADVPGVQCAPCRRSRATHSFGEVMRVT